MKYNYAPNGTGRANYPLVPKQKTPTGAEKKATEHKQILITHDIPVFRSSWISSSGLSFTLKSCVLMPETHSAGYIYIYTISYTVVLFPRFNQILVENWELFISHVYLNTCSDQICCYRLYRLRNFTTIFGVMKLEFRDCWMMKRYAQPFLTLL